MLLKLYFCLLWPYHYAVELFPANSEAVCLLDLDPSPVYFSSILAPVVLIHSSSGN